MRWLLVCGRFLRPDSWSAAAATQAAIAGGSLIAAQIAIALGELVPHPIDFVIFYRSAAAWLQVGALYPPQTWPAQSVNYNPPHLHLLLLPLARLPMAAAFLSWSALSAVFAAATIKIGMRESCAVWSRQERALLCCATFASAGVAATARLGQVSWLVAFLVALAWRADRRGHVVSTAVWLGLAIGLKPFLLLLLPALAIRRRWREAGGALVVAVMSVAFGAGIFGWSAVVSWLSLLQAPPPLEQVAYFINASFAGSVARSGLPAAVWASAAIVTVPSLFLFCRGLDDDRSWLLSLLACLLISPLGWIYYFPLLSGPLIVLAHEHRLPAWTWYAWPLLALPSFGREMFQQPRLLAVTVGSSYMWGLAILAAGTIQARRMAHDHRCVGVPSRPLPGSPLPVDHIA